MILPRLFIVALQHKLPQSCVANPYLCIWLTVASDCCRKLSGNAIKPHIIAKQMPHWTTKPNVNDWIFPSTFRLIHSWCPTVVETRQVVELIRAHAEPPGTSSESLAKKQIWNDLDINVWLRTLLDWSCLSEQPSACTATVTTNTFSFGSHDEVNSCTTVCIWSVTGSLGPNLPMVLRSPVRHTTQYNMSNLTSALHDTLWFRSLQINNSAIRW